MRTYKLTQKNIDDAETIVDSVESIAAARIAYLLALEDRAEDCIKIANHIAANFDGDYRDDAAQIAVLLSGEPVIPEPEPSQPARPSRKPTPEQLRMAVRLCNSHGGLVCGVMAERRVAELLMIEAEHAELLQQRNDWIAAAKRAVQVGEDLATSLMLADENLHATVRNEAPEALAGLRIEEVPRG